jgi:hypothetical protein
MIAREPEINTYLDVERIDAPERTTILETSRYSALVEMTDRRQAQSNADKPSSQQTEKIKQRANSGDGVKTNDVGMAD